MLVLVLINLSFWCSGLKCSIFCLVCANVTFLCFLVFVVVKCNFVLLSSILCKRFECIGEILFNL